MIAILRNVFFRLESSFTKIGLRQWNERLRTAPNCGESDGNVSVQMKLFVKTPDERILTFEVKSCHTIGSIKKQIQAIEGFAPDQQLRLIYIDRQLQDGFKLSHYNIQNESIMRLEIRRKVSECEWQTLTE